MNIMTSRIFIPHPTGRTLKGKTYGIKNMGYDSELYDFCKNYISDNVKYDNAVSVMYRDLHELISVHYGIDLSYVPKVNPYVAWIEWCQKNGGVVSYDTAKIEEVKRKCNVLIVPDNAEREYLAALYLGYVPSQMPARFLATARGAR